MSWRVPASHNSGCSSGADSGVVWTVQGAWEKERQKETKTEGHTHPFILKTATRLTFFTVYCTTIFFSESPFGLLATLRSAARAANVHWLCSIIIAVSTPPPSLQRVKERGSRGRPLIARGSEV